MRKFLSTWRIVILTVALVLAAEAVARVPAVQRLFDPADGSIYAARWRLAYAPRAPDVVLLGDSRNVMDLSPRAIASVLAQAGESPLIVNAAVHGSSMEQLHLFLQELLPTSSKPPVVVLNVSEVALNDTAWADTKPQYLQALAAPLALRSWSGEAGRSALLESISRLASLEHRLRLVVEERWPNYLRGSERYDWGAMVWHGQMDEAERAKQLGEYRQKYLRNFAPSGEQGQYFDKILAEARANNLRLILIISPVTSEYLAAYPSASGPEIFRAYVKEQATRYDVPVFDFYRTPLLGAGDYFDLHHTNAQGAARFSTMVADQVLRPALTDWDAFVAKSTRLRTASESAAP